MSRVEKATFYGPMFHKLLKVMTSSTVDSHNKPKITVFGNDHNIGNVEDIEEHTSTFEEH